jgi:hypothetical protein
VDNLIMFHADAEASTRDPENSEHTAINRGVTSKSARTPGWFNTPYFLIHASMISEFNAFIGVRVAVAQRQCRQRERCTPAESLSDLGSYAVCAGLRRS